MVIDDAPAMSTMLASPVRDGTQALRDALGVPAQDRAIEVEGGQIHYRLWPGAGPETSRPVLLVHGMFAHARWWDGVAGWLQEDRTVAALDLSGMGDSSWRDQYSRLQHAREIERVANELGYRDAYLVAHSYGGDPSVRACLAAPALFRSLILLDCRLLMPNVRDYALEREPVISARKIFPSFEAARERFRLLPATVHPEPHMFDHIARHSLVEVDGGWSWKFDRRLGMGGEVAGTLDPSALKLPVTFVRGEESDVTTPHQLAVTRQFLPHARFLTLPGAGHHVMVDQPLALAAMLRAILHD